MPFSPFALAKLQKFDSTVSEAVQKQAPCIAAGNTNWYNPCGGQISTIYQNYICIYPLTHQLYIWEFILELHLHACEMMSVQGYSLTMLVRTRMANNLNVHL